MKNLNLFQKLSGYQRAVAVLFFLSFLSIGGLQVTATMNYMDIPTFVSSWSANQVTAAQLQQGEVKPVILIDVRSPEEYDKDHIGDSQLVPITDIEAGFGVKKIRAIAQESAKSGQKPSIILYCKSGPRSFKAYRQLQNTGLNFVVLKGGITAWRQALSKSQDTRVLAPITMKARL